ncbi:hypothetical protein V6N13_014288 [Hibiscus sabdariffa]
MERICDSIILEVENECFMIHGVDLGLVDHACSPKNVSTRKSNPTLSEFSSESSTESYRRSNQSIGSFKTVVMDDDKASENEEADIICMGKYVLSGGLLNQENAALNLGVLEMLGSGGIMRGGKSATCPMNISPVLSDHIRKPDSFDNLDTSLVSNTGSTLPEDGFIDSVPAVGVGPSANLEHDLSFGQDLHLKSFDLEPVEGILGDQNVARQLNWVR